MVNYICTIGTAYPLSSKATTKPETTTVHTCPSYCIISVDVQLLNCKYDNNGHCTACYGIQQPSYCYCVQLMLPFKLIGGFVLVSEDSLIFLNNLPLYERWTQHTNYYLIRNIWVWFSLSLKVCSTIWLIAFVLHIIVIENAKTYLNLAPFLCSIQMNWFKMTGLISCTKRNLPICSCFLTIIGYFNERAMFLRLFFVDAFCFKPRKVYSKNNLLALFSTYIWAKFHFPTKTLNPIDVYVLKN